MSFLGPSNNCRLGVRPAGRTQRRQLPQRGALRDSSHANQFAQVFEGGKNAFVKFFAPWCDSLRNELANLQPCGPNLRCGHCKAAKPAWDDLGKEYADHPNVLIGDVDCTVSKDVCNEMGVSGYPTIKYWVDGGGKDDAKFVFLLSPSMQTLLCQGIQRRSVPPAVQAARRG